MGDAEALRIRDKNVSVFVRMPAQGSATATLVSPAAGVADFSSFRSTSGALPAAVSATAQPSLQSQYSLWSIKSKISVSEKVTSHLGWAIAFLSLIFTVMALSPAFKSQTAAQKALGGMDCLKDYVL